MFSKRHYEAVAAVLSKAGDRSVDHSGFLMWRAIFDHLADLFEADNPRFDRDTFKEACER